MTNTIVITRHSSYVEYLLEIGLISEGNYSVVSHATPYDVADKNVVTSGLPNSLACLAQTVTTIPLWLPENLRGVELSVEQVREYAKPPETFRVFAGNITLYEVVAYVGDGPGYDTRHSLFKTLSRSEAEDFLAKKKNSSMVYHTIEVFEL